MHFLVDIDECEIGNHTCHENADCTDTYGGFNCTCSSGYEGDGFFNCTSKETTNQLTGVFSSICYYYLSSTQMLMSVNRNSTTAMIMLNAQTQMEALTVHATWGTEEME